MYTVIIKSGFQAAHCVKMPNGEVEPQHQHRWLASVAVTAEKLDECGFAVEFVFLKKLLNDVLKLLDGKQLNDIEYFAANFPTAERVCKFIHEHVKKGLPSGVKLDYTVVEETQGCYVKYKD